MPIFQLSSRPGYFEGLHYHREKMWFSDFGSRTVFDLDAHGTLTPRAYVAGQPSGIGFLPDGDAVIASMHDGLLLIMGRDDHLALHADLSGHFCGPINDMAVDSRGNIYIGGFGYHAGYAPPSEMRPAPLVQVDLHGKAGQVAEGLLFPNGMALSPAEDRLYVAETFGNRISSFRIGSDGDLTEQAVFADLGEYGPDGLCADATGLWAACPFAEKVIHIDWQGVIDREISFDGRWAVTLAMAGSEGKLAVSLAETSLEDFHRGRAIAAIETIAL